MNNFDVIAKKALGSTELFLRRHGPEILTGIGIVGFGATTYLVGKAVLEAQQPLEDIKKRVQAVANQPITEEYTEKKRTQEVGKTWLIESVKIVRIFAPAIVTGSVSVFCIIASHGIMRRQQTSLVAAYMALDNAYRSYRKRVQEELGPEKEMELYRGIRVREITTDGEEYTACQIDTDEFLPSPYAKWFNESNPNWQPTAEWNVQFVLGQQQYANDRLTAFGFVFLNEVYDMLGLPRTQYGQAVGWLKKGDGDGYIDFGIYEVHDGNKQAFVNGFETDCLLDFNVDGIIEI